MIERYDSPESDIENFGRPVGALRNEEALAFPGRCPSLLHLSPLGTWLSTMNLMLKLGIIPQ